MFGFFGFEALTPGEIIMILIGMGLIFLAIGRNIEPLLLLPIGFGIVIANLPLSGLVSECELIQRGGATIYKCGLLHLFYEYGIARVVIPPLIFLGLGVLTDFSPLLANPRTIFLAAAAQIGIYITFFGALLVGFTLHESASVGIIGGADGPTTIYLTTLLAPHLIGATAIAAYSYMALVPIIQPPIMRALTTEEERKIEMVVQRVVSKRERVIFPLLATIIVILIVPHSAPLVGMFMLGNLMKESGVVARLASTAQNELMNIITIILGLAIGSTMTAENFLKEQTLLIFALGLFAFAAGTAGGVLFGKFMNIFSRKKINPLIGAAGVSAVPMAARVAQKIGREANPRNNLLMHAMGPNVAGVIGSAIVAGVFLGML